MFVNTDILMGDMKTRANAQKFSHMIRKLTVKRKKFKQKSWGESNASYHGKNVTVTKQRQ